MHLVNGCADGENNQVIVLAKKIALCLSNEVSLSLFYFPKAKIRSELLESISFFRGLIYVKPSSLKLQPIVLPFYPLCCMERNRKAAYYTEI